MRAVWVAVAVGTALVAPAFAQEDPVKEGVDAWQAGDYKTAVDKWRGPATAGNPDAEFNLAQAYKLGRGVTADLAQAEQWYQRAALQGHPQAEDNYGLALFQNGKRAEAVQWLQKSASRGEPRAQFVLGTMFFNGDVVEKDWVRAYALIVRSSQSGLTEASQALTQMDKYMSLGDRQQGLALARRYEEEANRAVLTPDLIGPPPRLVASSQPQPGSTAPAATVPLPRPTYTPAPRPTPVARPPKPAPVAVAVTTPVVRDGGWKVQLGAFGDPGNAHRLWAQVGGRFPGRQAYFVKTGSLTRLLIGPFGSKGEAVGACAAVKPCVPIGP